MQTRFFGVDLVAAKAGVIADRKGRAMEAPAPRRKVRRSRGVVVERCIGSGEYGVESGE